MNNLATNFTIPDLLRYSLAYLCLLLLTIPAGWAMLEMLSFVSLTWLNLGGDLRLHKVGYYGLSSYLAVIWVSASIFAEDWFRSSIYAVRAKRARTRSAAGDDLPESVLMQRLQKMGLDLLFRRVRIAAGLVIVLVVWNFIVQQIFAFVNS